MVTRVNDREGEVDSSSQVPEPRAQPTDARHGDTAMNSFQYYMRKGEFHTNSSITAPEIAYFPRNFRLSSYEPAGGARTTRGAVQMQRSASRRNVLVFSRKKRKKKNLKIKAAVKLCCSQAVQKPYMLHQVQAASPLWADTRLRLRVRRQWFERCIQANRARKCNRFANGCFKKFPRLSQVERRTNEKAPVRPAPGMPHPTQNF